MVWLPESLNKLFRLWVTLTLNLVPTHHCRGNWNHQGNTPTKDMESTMFSAVTSNDSFLKEINPGKLSISQRNGKYWKLWCNNTHRQFWLLQIKQFKFTFTPNNFPMCINDLNACTPADTYKSSPLPPPLYHPIFLLPFTSALLGRLVWRINNGAAILGNHPE